MRSPRSILLSVLTVAGSMLLLDLTWLGVVAAPLYAKLLGPLMAPAVNGLAAAAFYAMYVGAVVIHAVLPAASVPQAARRGAGLGFVAYATYDLTNWAVIAGWPAALVPIDLAWGVLLTATVAAAGFGAAGRAPRDEAPERP
jgi:uncharacterized membrane protein